jgi:putative flippase GtrA
MRAVRFVVVGAVGFLVQGAVLTALTFAHWPIAPATACAVECAVLTNYVWHTRWTWRDRRADREGRRVSLVRFHVASGLASLVGTTAITTALVRGHAVYPLVANAVAVAMLAAVSYTMADRWVFAELTAGRAPER